MEFIKPIIRQRGGNHVAGIGSLIISNGYLRIRINVPNARLKDIGLIKGGIGVVLEESKNRKIKCDYLLFGSNVVSITGNTHAKLTGGFWYLKNNDDFTGDADQFKDKYGAVATVFYSNTQFLSSGRQYKNDSHVSENIMFGKDRLTEVKGV